MLEGRRGKLSNCSKDTWVELHFVIHHQAWYFSYLVNIWIFFWCSSNSRNCYTSFCWSWNRFIIQLLSFFFWTVSVLAKGLCFSCFSWALQSPLPRYVYLFHLTSWWESSISAFHLSCSPQYERCILFPLSFPPPKMRCYLSLTLYWQTGCNLYKGQTWGEVCVHLFIYSEMWEAVLLSEFQCNKLT